MKECVLSYLKVIQQRFLPIPGMGSVVVSEPLTPRLMPDDRVHPDFFFDANPKGQYRTSGFHDFGKHDPREALNFLTKHNLQVYSESPHRGRVHVMDDSERGFRRMSWPGLPAPVLHHCLKLDTDFDLGRSRVDVFALLPAVDADLKPDAGRPWFFVGDRDGVNEPLIYPARSFYGFVDPHGVAGHVEVSVDRLLMGASLLCRRGDLTIGMSCSDQRTPQTDHITLQMTVSELKDLLQKYLYSSYETWQIDGEVLNEIAYSLCVEIFSDEKFEIKKFKDESDYRAGNRILTGGVREMAAGGESKKIIEINFFDFKGEEHVVIEIFRPLSYQKALFGLKGDLKDLASRVMERQVDHDTQH